MMRKVEKKALGLVALDAGNNYGGTLGGIDAKIPLPLFSATGPIRPQPLAMAALKREFEKQAFRRGSGANRSIFARGYKHTAR